MHKFILWLTGLLTIAIALFAFVLSFNALRDLAQAHGVSIPELFPLVVEFAVVVFSLNALARSLSGQSAKVQWALVIGSSLIAGGFNIAHAEAHFIDRAMAAMPSLFLLLSFETFLSLVKGQVSSSPKRRKRVKTPANERFTPGDLDALDKANDRRKLAMNERRQAVLELVSQNVSHTDMADELNVSLSTIKRDLVALNGKVTNELS